MDTSWCKEGNEGLEFEVRNPHKLVYGVYGAGWYGMGGNVREATGTPMLVITNHFFSPPARSLVFPTKNTLRLDMGVKFDLSKFEQETQRWWLRTHVARAVLGFKICPKWPKKSSFLGSLGA